MSNRSGAIDKGHNSDDVLRDFFLEDYKQIRAQHQEIMTQLASQRRTIKILTGAVSVVLAVATFFGYNAFNQVRDTIDQRIANGLDKRLQHVDSILNNRTRYVDSLTGSIEARNQHTERMVANTERNRLVTDSMVRWVSRREQEGRRLLSAADSQAKSVRSSLFQLQQSVSASEDQAIAANERVDRLTHESEAAYERMLAALPVNRRVLPRAVGLRAAGYNFKTDHSTFQIVRGTVDSSSSGRVEVYVQLPIESANRLPYLMLLLTTQGADNSVICDELYEARVGLNRLQCPTPGVGTYNLWVGAVSHEQLRVRNPTLLAMGQVLQIN